MNSLNAAIENLYAAFGDVPKPTRIEGCPCCISPDEIETLTQKPLRELTSMDLKAAHNSMPWTVGTWQDFWYFLPRMLELSCTDQQGFFDPEMLLSRRNGEEYRFTSREFTALQEWLWALWQRTLQQWPDGYPAGETESILACVVFIDAPLAPYLQYWLEAENLEALALLTGFIHVNFDELQRDGVWSAFLNDEYSSFPKATERKAAVSAEMLAWLSQPNVIRKVQEFEAVYSQELDDHWHELTVQVLASLKGSEV